MNNTPLDSAPIKPGSVNIKEVVLFKAGEEIPLTDYVLEISSFEDIFSSSLAVTMLISDGANLIGTLPITGGEIVNIVFNVPGLEETQIFGKAFYLYGVKNRTPASTDRQQVYVLSLISLEAAVDNVTVVSKKFTGEPIKIAKEIFDDYLAMPRLWSKEYEIPAGISEDEDLTRPGWRKALAQNNVTQLQLPPDASSKNKVAWVAPLWSPMKCINWLANRQIGQDGKAPNTLFWETSQQFYFTSLESIFKSQKDTDKKMYFYGMDDATIQRITSEKKTTNKLIEGYKKVEDISIPVNYDVLKSQDMGHYSSTMMVFDVVTKKYDEYVYDYINNYQDYEHLDGNTKPTFPTTQIRNFFSYITFRPKHKKIFNDFEDPKFEDWVLQRTSLLYDISNLKLEITVPGLPNTEAGEVIQFYYPHMGKKSDEGEVKNLVDQYLSGTYLITAVRHIVTRERYVMKLEIVKESLATGLG